MKQSIIHGDVSFVGIIRYKHFNCCGCDREEGLESTMAQTDLNTNFCVDSIHKLPVITFLMTKFQILTRKCKGVQTLILQMLPNLTCCKLKIVKQLFKNKQRPNCEAKPGARVCSTETPKKPWHIFAETRPSSNIGGVGAGRASLYNCADFAAILTNNCSLTGWLDVWLPCKRQQKTKTCAPKQPNLPTNTRAKHRASQATLWIANVNDCNFLTFDSF